SAIVGGLFGFDAGAEQPLSPTEQANAPHFLLLNEVMRPVVASALANHAPVDMLRTFVAGGAAPAAPSPAEHTEDVAAMKKRITALEEAIKHLHTTRGNG